MPVAKRVEADTKQIIWVAIAFAIGYVLSANESKAQTASQAEADAIGLDATDTAALILSASDGCRTIGIYSLNDCAVHHGPLTEDKIWPDMASSALKSYKEYMENCQKKKTKEWCETLLRRAESAQSKSKSR